VLEGRQHQVVDLRRGLAARHFGCYCRIANTMSP
jgi:hypothetical protein